MCVLLLVRLWSVILRCTLVITVVSVKPSLPSFLREVAETLNIPNFTCLKLGCMKLVSLPVLGILIPPSMTTCGCLGTGTVFSGSLSPLVHLVSLRLSVRQLEIGLWLGLSAV